MEEIPVSMPALPSQPCQTPPRQEWTDPEKWVWQQVCEGKIADFNTFHKKELGSRDSNGWSHERLISPEFLETILLHDPFQSAVPRQGVRITGAWLTEPLELEDARLVHSWWLGKSRMDAEVRLSGLESTHSISFEGSMFTAALNLDRARIGGQLDMTGAKCTGTLIMEALTVGRDLFMREGAEFREKVNLIFASIGSNLDLSGAKLSSLDMTGTRVQGELRLGSGHQPKPIWDEDKESRLTLRNAVVGALQDRHEEGAWPGNLDLGGFTYTRLGGFQSEEGGSDIAARKAAWFIDWLKKDQSYTPQPYHQLASVLRAMGHMEAVNAILFAGKERERHEARGWKWWGLSLLKWVIGYGYGYRYFFSLFWVVAITLIGVFVLATVDNGAPSTLAQKAAFSFDLLLPIIKLDESHKIMFEGWQRYYFYVHQLMGFVLGSFVVAGLSGITKK